MEHFKFGDLYDVTHQPFKQVVQPTIFFRGTNGIEEFAENSEDDELENIIRQREIAEQMLSEILPKIKNQLKTCTEVRDNYCNWHHKLSDHRCSLLSLNKDTESQDAALQGYLSGLYAQLNDLQKEAAEYYALINKKAKEINDKRAELEKWCWVPFYNLYLLGDYESSLKQYQEKYNRLQGQMNSLQSQINDKLREISGKSTISGNIKKLLQIYEHENVEITSRMNQISQIVAQWNQFYAFFLKLKSDLETIDDVQPILDSANEQLREAKKAESNVDYKNFQSHEVFLGSYEIKTYDEKFNLINEGNGLNLYNFTVQDYDSQKTWHTSNHFYKIVTLSDYTSIILNEENNVLTCYRNKEVRFEPIEIQNNKIKSNQLLCISKYQNSPNWYKFTDGDHISEFCLDVQWGDFINYTPIQMWESNNTISQKFIIR